MANKLSAQDIPSFEELPQAVLISDAQFRILYSNKAVKELIKGKDEAFSDKKVTDLLPFFDDVTMKDLKGLSAGECLSFEEILSPLKGQEFRVMVRVRSLRAGREKRYVWVFLDFTEELESRQEMIDFMAELSRAKRKIQDYAGRIEIFRRIVNTINQGLIVIQEDRRCFFRNTTADEIFGLDHSRELSEETLLRCISHPGDLPLTSSEALEEALAAGPLRGEVLILDVQESREVRCYLTIFQVPGAEEGDDAFRVWNLMIMEEELARQQRFIDFSAELTALNRQLREKSEEVVRLSRLDIMTGAFNRNHILALLDEELTDRLSRGASLGLLLFDLDDFKKINDVYGHLFGDEVLRLLTRKVLEELMALEPRSDRGSGWIGRYGGEEFLIVLPGRNREESSQWAEHLIAEVNGIDCGFTRSGQRLGISIGAASLRPGDTVDDLLHRADMAMYQAKKAGKNQVVEEKL